ncbi:hypothetical protein BT63DRAFT_59190 [Microthyrium microscopicum]|uniref:Zn(2)-C6 fungal-type domain-containing protein n=1 Tax=Microthyrium microscopicum TaxID=703497 RepID=A0A6A6U3F9_9PEZI|nr:hypothetical protein BT63DRAFT_59190 [Microthyrium microscopicum]
MAIAAVLPSTVDLVAKTKASNLWIPISPVPPTAGMSKITQAQGSHLTPASSNNQSPLNIAPTPSSSLEPSISSTTPTSPNSGGKKILPSRSFISSEIRRSSSFPAIRGLIQPETGTISSPADKRRNKLGYQRTSMACGHCRRRKIRCIPPTSEDPQGRCANCIRLKKECIFFPVDHVTEVRPGKREVGSISTSSTSSPQTPLPSSLPGQPPPIIESQAGSHYEQPIAPSVTIPSQPSRSGGEMNLSVPYRHDSIPSEISPFQSNFTFSQHEDSNDWHHTDSSHHQRVPSPYWGSSASTPSRPNFSPNPMLSPEPSFHPGHQPQHLVHPQYQPERSASFSQLEGGFANFHFPDNQQPSGYATMGMSQPMESHSGSLPSHGLTPNGTVHGHQHMGSHDPRGIHLMPHENVHTGWVQPNSQGHWFAEPGTTNEAHDANRVPYSSAF